MDNLQWHEVAETPSGRGTLQQQTSEFQATLHRNALGRLERELRQFIRTMPRQELPTYHGAAPPPPPPPLPSDPDMADRVYSRSVAQRYVLQRLAQELHGPLEEKRYDVPLSVFQEVLQVPNSLDLPRLHPHVVDRVVVPERSTSNITRSANDSLTSFNNGQNNPDRQRPEPQTQAQVPTARLVFDMASFSNMASGIRVTNYRHR